MITSFDPRTTAAVEDVGPESTAADVASQCAAAAAAASGLQEAGPGDLAAARQLVDWFAGRAGRIVWNGYPTGVAVSWATQHGGPYPATTDSLHTSVGASAIRRWLRPVAHQDVPADLLPPELADTLRAGIRLPRRVNGTLAAR